MVYSFVLRNWPEDIDREIVPLLDALNAIPGIETTASCCGHGTQPVRIWLRARRPDGLFFLTRCVDRRYWEYGYQWSIRMSVGDMMRDSERPADYVLESQGANGYGVLGLDAYQQCQSLVENMLAHLQIEKFMDGFDLNVDDFDVDEVQEHRARVNFDRMAEHVRQRYDRLGAHADCGVDTGAFLELWGYVQELRGAR